EEGKYHYDGHRACGITLSPRETIQNNYLCPVCGKKVTVGVLHRVEKLADRESGYQPEGALPFRSIIPLQEVLAETLKKGVSTKTVKDEYERLIQKLGNEFTILTDIPLDVLEREGSPLLRKAIQRMRTGNIHISPGFDGEYGKIKIFENVTRRAIKGQTMLF
ncbi:MAG: endonuclease Q family protein, partial [Thermodesulfovibrionales bacterium]|nr:endonuclease Q family protein [Thermodesulfovibrionales bacterium]